MQVAFTAGIVELYPLPASWLFDNVLSSPNARTHTFCLVFMSRTYVFQHLHACPKFLVSVYASADMC